MSSNNHTNPVINSSNYEEWFLLYVDEELNAAERKAVEVFAAAHPQLQEELDLLCSTRLPMDTVRLENKEALFSGNMKMNTVDESLLLYIDNELNQAEQKSIEARLASDQDLQLQYLLLLKTKAAAPVIEFPNKKSLYRHTQRRIVPIWLRAAAAVVLVAGTGAAFWFTGDTVTEGTTPEVAVVAGPAPVIKNNQEDQMPAVIKQQQPDF